MSADVHRAVVRRFVEEGVGRGDLAVLQELAAPECVDHAARAHGGDGLAAVAAVAVEWHAACPDFRLTVEDLVAEGEWVVVQATLRGTHRGDFFGLPPTGRPLAVDGLARYRVAGGRIVECWAYLDVVALCAQLGVPALPPRLRGRRARPRPAPGGPVGGPGRWPRRCWRPRAS